MIGNGPEIGVTAPAEALLFVVAVAWPDLSSATRPGTAQRPPGLKLLASKSDVRAWPGGFGYAKGKLISLNTVFGLCGVRARILQLLS